MSKAGQRLLQGAREALEFAKGNVDSDAYRVHHSAAHESENTSTVPGSSAKEDSTSPGSDSTTRFSRPVQNHIEPESRSADEEAVTS